MAFSSDPDSVVTTVIADAFNIAAPATVKIHKSRIFVYAASSIAITLP